MLNQRNQTINAYVGQMVCHLLRLQIGVEFVTERENGDDADSVYNYFDGENGILKVVMITKEGDFVPEMDWLYILTHEYCHFLQHLDYAAGVATAHVNYPDAGKDFFAWLDTGADVTNRDLKDLITYTVQMERDCEVRSMRHLNAADSQIGYCPREYAKAANSYLRLYAFAMKYRLWPDIAPYRCPEILEAMPVELGTWQNALDLDPDYEALMKKHCFFDFEKRHAEIQSVRGVRPDITITEAAISPIESLFPGLAENLADAGSR